MEIPNLNKMEVDQSLQLRPRFEFFTNQTVEEIKTNFETLKVTHEPEFKIKMTGHYIHLGIGMLHREYWSPNLQLELEPYEDSRTHVRGVFGPDPVLWTLFMFLHFVIAGIFLIFAVIVYSKWNLGNPFKFDLVVMFIMTNFWFLLYFIARLNRKKGIPQTEELKKLLLKGISVDSEIKQL